MLMNVDPCLEGVNFEKKERCQKAGGEREKEIETYRVV